MSFVEEDIIFGLVTDVGAEILADDAVPVSAVLLVELFFDVFGHEIFCFEVVDCVFSLG